MKPRFAVIAGRPVELGRSGVAVAQERGDVAPAVADSTSRASTNAVAGKYRGPWLLDLDKRFQWNSQPHVLADWLKRRRKA